MRFSVYITGISELEDGLDGIARKLAEYGRREAGYVWHGLAGGNERHALKAASGIPGHTGKPRKPRVKGSTISAHPRGLMPKKGG